MMKYNDNMLLFSRCFKSPRISHFSPFQDPYSSHSLLCTASYYYTLKDCNDFSFAEYRVFKVVSVTVASVVSSKRKNRGILSTITST